MKNFMKRCMTMLLVVAMVLSSNGFGLLSQAAYAAEIETADADEVDDANEANPENVVTVDVEALADESTSEEDLASGTCGDNLTWVLASDGTLTISGTGAMYDYAYSTKSSSDTRPWKKYSSKVTAVVIEDGVTYVGTDAFHTFTSITSVTMADSVTSLGEYAFYNCWNITNLQLSEELTAISNYAFGRCIYLVSVTIPESVTSIGNYAFYECDDLAEITLPSGLISIGDYAFQECRALRSILLPSGLEELGAGVFKQTGITSITIPDSITEIPDYAFYLSSLTSITMPDTVTSIGDYAFSYTQLTEITLPPLLTSLGASAFASCTSLTTSIEIPEGVTSIGDRAFYGCTYLASITLSYDVTTIGSSAFYKCTALTEITIPYGVTSIGSSAFYGCTGLTEITVPDSVTCIGDNAFLGCTSLQKLTMGNVTSLGEEIVSSTCTNLLDVYYGGTMENWLASNSDEQTYRIHCSDGVIEAVGSFWSFDGDGTLTISGLSTFNYSTTWYKDYWDKEDVVTVIIESGVEVGYNAFDSEYTNLKNLVLRDGVTKVSGSAFVDGNDLETVTIEGNLTSASFSECANLKLATFADGVTKVPSGIFSECTNLTTVSLADSITTIGDGAFYGCTNLENVELPESLVSYGGSAFAGCEKITSIVLPETVTVSGDLSFQECVSLENIEVYGDCASLGRYFVQDCSSLKTLTLPATVTSMGSEAFGSCDSLTDVFYGGSIYVWNTMLENSYNDLPASVNVETVNSLEIVQSGTYGDQTWTLDDAGTLIITGTGTLDSDASWSDYGYTIYNIIIGEGITEIGSEAFYGYDRLESVMIASTVTLIDRSAFWSCDALISASVPAYAEVESNAFPVTTTLYVYENSWGAHYAIVNGNPWVSVGEVELEEVRVSTTEELLAAIDSYRRIILADGVYETAGTLQIKDVCALTIEAENSGKAEILCDVLDTTVVEVRSSHAVEFNGVIMGHVSGELIDSSGCSGDGVVYRAASSTFPRLVDCDLFGCGTIAVQISGSYGFTAKGCVMRDCLYYAAYIYSSDAEFTDCVISGNGYGQNYTYCINLGGLSEDEMAVFKDCTFLWNLNSKLATESQLDYITFDEDCIFEDNIWQDEEPKPYGICVNGITWQVADDTLYLGYDLTFDDGTVITSKKGEVLPYSSSSLPWVDLKSSFTKVNLADGIIYDYDIDIRLASITVSGSYTYTGSAITPTVTVTYEGTVLQQGTDYMVYCADNIDVGTANATIAAVDGSGYTGTTVVEFTIGQASQTVTASAASSSIKYGKTTTITASTTGDGTITYSSSNTAVATVSGSGSSATVTAKGAGTATITVTAAATDNCTKATKTITITVTRASQTLSVSSSSVTLTVGGTSTPTVSGAKTTLSYSSSNTSVATVSSSGKITAKKVGTATITVTAAQTSAYSKATKTITVKVKPAATTISSVANTTSGVKITWKKVTGASGYYIYRATSASGTYTQIAKVTSGSTVSYTNKTSGTYKVSSGKTYYYKVSAYASTGTASKSSAKSICYLTAGKVSSVTNTSSGVTVKWGKVTGASGYYIYRKAGSGSYKKIATISKASTVSYTNKTSGTYKVANGTTYTYYVIPYYKNSSGTISKGTYSATKTTVYLTVNKISSLKNSSSKKMTVKWAKNTKATGYQIQYSTSSSFASGNKTVTISKASTTSSTIGKLTKSKTYYVRVRTYKKVSGTKYYSAWSTKKSVKISK